MECGASSGYIITCYVSNLNMNIMISSNVVTLICFRLENEHLNNVGKYRAFKSVPHPFHYYDNDETDDKDD